MFIVMGGGYGCKNSGCVVRLCSMAARSSTGMVGVRLHTIGSNAGEAAKFECAAA